LENKALESCEKGMAYKKIPISRIELTDEEIESVRGPLTSGQVAQGPFVEEFERKWQAFNGSKHAIATSSCTTALHLCLAALGIGPGDEVIVPAFTHLGGHGQRGREPGGKTCFLRHRPSHVQYGRFPSRGAFRGKHESHHPRAPLRPARRHEAHHGRGSRPRGLIVVEDAACGFGALYRGTSVGKFRHAGCFSFHPRKAITTGEGGMIVTDDDALTAPKGCGF